MFRRGGAEPSACRRGGAEPSVPTLAAQTRPPRSDRKAADAAMYSIGLRPLHLCGTRLEGGHQGLSPRYGQLDGEPLGMGVAAEAGRYGGRADMSFPAWLALSSRLRCLARTISARWGRPFGDDYEPGAGAALLCRLDLHEPQGWGESSVPTLEASSAQVERP